MVGHLARLRQDLEEIVQARADSNADDEHDPEGSTIAFEGSQLQSSIHRAERRCAGRHRVRRHRAVDKQRCQTLLGFFYREVVAGGACRPWWC